MVNENIFGLILVLTVVFGLSALLRIVFTALFCRKPKKSSSVSSSKSTLQTYDVGIFNFDAQFTEEPSSAKYTELIRTVHKNDDFRAA